jgi:hypothetical protein
MTITLEYGHYVLTCAVCDEPHHEQFESFEDAWDYAKSNGWKLERQPGKWGNACPRCQTRK